MNLIVNKNRLFNIWKNKIKDIKQYREYEKWCKLNIQFYEYEQWCELNKMFKDYDEWCEINNETIMENEFAANDGMDSIHWCWNCKYHECDIHH